MDEMLSSAGGPRPGRPNGFSPWVGRRRQSKEEEEGGKNLGADFSLIRLTTEGERPTGRPTSVRFAI